MHNSSVSLSPISPFFLRSSLPLSPSLPQLSSCQHAPFVAQEEFPGEFQNIPRLCDVTNTDCADSSESKLRTLVSGSFVPPRTIPTQRIFREFEKKVRDKRESRSKGTICTLTQFWKFPPLTGNSWSYEASLWDLCICRAQRNCGYQSFR